MREFESSVWGRSLEKIARSVTSGKKPLRWRERAGVDVVLYRLPMRALVTKGDAAHDERETPT